MHPTVSNQHPFVPTDSLFPEADWLSSDASVGRQIDDYAQVNFHSFISLLFYNMWIIEIRTMI
jgi:hypothetical protein